MFPNELISRTKSLIQSSNTIHLYTHAFPDGDALASFAAMKEILSWFGKVVVCRCDTEVGSTFDWLEIIPNNSYRLPPPDLIVTVDFGDLSQLGRLYQEIKKDFDGLPIINIDHHFRTNARFGTVNLVGDFASTTLVLYRLFQQWPLQINEKLASILYYGLLSDTHYFQRSNTDGCVMQAAAELVKLGAKPAILAQRAYKTKSLEIMKLWGDVISRLELYHDDELAIGTVALLTLKKFLIGEYEADIDTLINLLTNIKTTKITILLKERVGEVSVSFRSDLFGASPYQIIDVSKIAKDLGGGGHVGASGCTLKMPLDSAKGLVIRECSKVLDSI